MLVTCGMCERVNEPWILESWQGTSLDGGMWQWRKGDGDDHLILDSLTMIAKPLAMMHRLDSLCPCVQFRVANDVPTGQQKAMEGNGHKNGKNV